MPGRRTLAVTALLALVAGCTGEPAPVPTQSAHPSTSPVAAGAGVFRSAIEDFAFSAGFDPTSESSRLGMGLLSQLVLRTLVTYRHIAGPHGLSPVPDLATDLGMVSADGLAWTFTLKRDVWFGPPVHRPITSADVEFAFRRIDSKALHAQYGYLYDGLIEGMDGPVDSTPADISGIEAPDTRTVIFHLRHPAGDFLHRLALPATAPMPPEVAGCFKKAGDYGRDVVATGPYMIEGADAVDISRCRSIEPMAGFQPTRDLYLVRNPAYDAATDDLTVRENHPDTIDIGIITNTDEIADLVGRGVLEASLGAYPDGFAFAKASHPSRLRWRPLNRLEYISMNVLVPPFDDFHVRRAVNLVLDRAAMVNALGDSARGEVATGLFPPWIVPGSGAPRPSPHGDVAAARHEMSMSAYDGNGDGVCDASACRRIVMANPPSTPPETNIYPFLKAELAQIGIHVEIRFLDCYCGYFAQFVRKLVPISVVRPSLENLLEPFSTARSLSSTGITCIGQTNFSEVGMTETQARRCGVLDQWYGVRDHLPNLDPRIETCERLSVQSAANCWAAFDSYVMDQVLPWAPLWFPYTMVATGPTITKFEYDQAFGIISLAHIAVEDTAI